MRGLPQLEHDVVRRVHHVVDRAHPGQEQALGDPARRRPDHDVVEHRDREPGAQLGRRHRRRRRRLDRSPARRRVGRLRRVERELEARREVAGDPHHRPRVGAVALDGDVEDGVGLEPQRLGQRRARFARGLVAQDQQAGAVVGEPELLPRAQHPVGPDAAHLAADDLVAAGQDGSDRSEGHAVPHREVVRPAHDLQRLGPGIDDDAADLVGTLDRVDLEHPADHHVAQPLPHVLDPLDDQPEVVERVAQCPDVVGERGEVTEPAQRGAHGGRRDLSLGWALTSGMGSSGIGSSGTGREWSELREEADVVLQE